ncbi:MAG: hypothetical protein KA224_02105 [Steroidobacteraceae bacterium]|nr:hypothetical protein [Steroidobacteraceae bacterium]MCC7200687.1 hypothetical protein [Gammaproteobacteria bacterium]
MQSRKPVVAQSPAVADPPAGAGGAGWKDNGPAPSRHGAIARELPSFSSYRNWAERMRPSFEPSPVPAAPAMVPRGR